MKRETLEERHSYYQNLIPVLYPQSFPRNFKLMPLDWIVSSDDITRPQIKLLLKNAEMQIRPLSTLDIEILSNDIVLKARNNKVDLVKNYPCGLKCPGCFSEESIFGESQKLLLFEEVISVIDVAISIGLKSVKFLGPGELFQNPDLFNILDEFESRKLPISIFTKGAELGDNELAIKNYGHLGINSAKELVNKISNYSCVRILLGFNSFFSNRQDSMVGSNSLSTSYSNLNGIFENRGISKYTEKRDQALVNLVEAGFNDPLKGQRLTLVMAPILKNQIDEVAIIFEWAARRNIPLIITPTMESGPKSLKLAHKHQNTDPNNNWLKEVYRLVYEAAFKMNITDLKELKKKGLSAYIGTEGCNQVANGLMIRLNGQVKICPGSSKSSHIYGSLYNEKNILEPERLIEIWKNSSNYRLGPIENNWCPAKTSMLPFQLQDEVFNELEKLL